MDTQTARPISSLHCLPAPLQLRWLLPQTTFEHDGLYLCYPRRASLAPKLRAFIDMARNHLNEQCPVQEPFQKAAPECASIHLIPSPRIVLANHGSSPLRKVGVGYWESLRWQLGTFEFVKFDCRPPVASSTAGRFGAVRESPD